MEIRPFLPPASLTDGAGPLPPYIKEAAEESWAADEQTDRSWRRKAREEPGRGSVGALSGTVRLQVRAPRPELQTRKFSTGKISHTLRTSSGVRLP